MTNPLAQDLGGVVLLPCPFCGYRMTDEEGGVYQKSGFIGAQTPVWEVCCGTTMCNASVTATSREFAITAWNTRAHSAEIAGALRDAERLDYIERTFTGMSNGERYLPLVMGWGKSRNGRTLREACDKYMQRESAMQQGGGGGE